MEIRGMLEQEGRKGRVAVFSQVHVEQARFDGSSDQQESGFRTERPVGIVSGTVVDRLSIPSILSTSRFLPRRNGCTDSVAEIRLEDPFSSGINVTLATAADAGNFGPLPRETFVYFKPKITRTRKSERFVCVSDMLDIWVASNAPRIHGRVELQRNNHHRNTARSNIRSSELCHRGKF